MGTEEEQMVRFCNNDTTHIAKGKRTKRMRLLSPCGVVAVMTSSCSSANSACENASFSSTTITHDHLEEEEEEQDMANCLILLAQGGGGNHKQQQQQQQGGDAKKAEKSRRFAEIITTTTATTNTKVGGGFYIYECKTCNRTFPSFQALGGHRASHKRPKIMPDEKKPSSPSPPPPLPPPSSSPLPPVSNFEEFVKQAGDHRGPANVNHGQRGFHGNKAKIHECSICGSEFTSGQALGGHMRRHRTSSANTVTAVADVGGVWPRNILQLDLNLPAPEDDLRESMYQFPAAPQKSMVLSAAPALVDCHY